MEQSPIFIPLNNIEHYPDPFIDPDRAGRIDLVPKGDMLQGFRCTSMTAEYMWSPNDKRCCFSQSLLCRFKGSEPHFNYMTRIMAAWDNRFIILLPRRNNPCLVFGNYEGEIELARRSVEHQTFVLECQYNIVPFPFYEGQASVTDCTVPDLMWELYGIRFGEDD